MKQPGNGEHGPFDDGPLDTAVAATPQPSRRRSGAMLARCGWWICGGGLPVTLLGSHLISSAGKSPSEFAQSVHYIGLLILLLGLVVALIGYRIMTNDNRDMTNDQY
jgi:hypothetical protein